MIRPKVSSARPELSTAFEFTPGFGGSCRGPDQQQHFHSECVGDLHQIQRPVTLQTLDRLLDFQCVTTRSAKRAVHCREQCHSGAAALMAQSNHGLRQLDAWEVSGMNAPLPVFTSSTRPLRPSASFFDMILAEISGIDSTVPVTSRKA